ncbi:hypothetical protein VPH35_103911 [Triticum aestivum]
MEPIVLGRPTLLDVHYPMVSDQNSLVCLVNISPPRAAFLPWLRRVFRQLLGISAVRFTGSAVGSRLVHILPHNAGDNAYSFSFRQVVNLSLEKLPLELWSRRGVTASVAGFASLFRVEHACLHGSEFSSIFVLVKVEALQHIPHHLTFHHIDGVGIYADVVLNEVWDVTRSLGAPSAPPRPAGRIDSEIGDLSSLAPPRQGQAHPQASAAFLHPHLASVGDCMVMSKISFKPKLTKGAVFSLPTAAQIGHEDEGRHCLLSSLLAAGVRKPRATVSFDPEVMTFSFQLELSNCRSTSGVVQVVDGGLCARTLPLLPAIESKYPPKPNVPAGLLPTVGPPLSLAGGDLPPFESLFPGHDHMRAHQILTSRPVCTRPAAHVPRPEPGQEPPLRLRWAAPQWPACPGAGGCLSIPPSQPPHLRCVRRVCLGLVQRSSKHKAAASASTSSGGSSGSRSSASSSRCKKAKAVAMAGLLELPLLSTPASLTRGKLKQIALHCDLNVNAILDQAQAREPAIASTSSSAPAS